VSATTKLCVYEDATERWRLIEGDALELLARLPEGCLDAVVTDPPYGLSFHDEAWDGADIHRIASSGRLGAGEAFERFSCLWANLCLRLLRPGGHLLACGAPRTFHRLVAGVEDAGLEVRDQVLWLYGTGMPKSRRLPGGRGTALKPAYEPILIARKPMEGATAANLLRHGAGALNIDAARVERTDAPGYWPANLALTHSPDCPAGLLDGASSGPSRLFYCAKATEREREAGCESLPLRPVRIYNGRHHRARLVRNVHPTVKPLDLMRWLVRLVVPQGGLVLDPFAGSGSTGVAALSEGRRFLGVERQGEYLDVACARLAHWASGTEPR